jgi:hypothetical protein
MVESYNVILVIHVAAAVISLLTFWAAVALPKGERHHLFAGRLYVRSMVVMLATAGGMSVAQAVAPEIFGRPETPLAPDALTHHLQEVRHIAVVLVGIALVTASLLFFGVRARYRLETVRLRERGLDVVMLLVPGVVGAIAVPFSRFSGWDALDGVGVMLIATSALLVHRVVRPGLWLREHIVGVLGSGVVIHGALATNLAPRLVGLDGADAFAAAGPVVPIGIALVVWACRHYTGRPRRVDPGTGVWATDLY